MPRAAWGVPLACRSFTRATSHYALLGLAESFEVDQAQLESKYKELQRQFHPDRHVASSEEDKAAAEEQSARVNEAVAVLRTPLRRAEYWMTLKGQAVLLEEQRIEDAATMMEVMETSEELDDAKTQEQVDEIRARNNSKIRAVEAELASLFSKEDFADTHPGKDAVRSARGERARGLGSPPSASLAQQAK